MPVSSPAIEAASIVLAGSLNPGIFHPQWFARHDLIRSAEAEEAQEVLVTAEYSRFETEWFSIEVLPDRMSLLTQLSPYYPLLRDLALSIIQILPHTPIQAVGLNRSAHYELDNEELWHSVGHRLAPKDVWNDILKSPGTRRLTVQGERPDTHKGMILVTVEPSLRLGHGLFVDINDHFAERAKDDEVDEGRYEVNWAEHVLNDHWEPHDDLVSAVQRRLLDYAQEGTGD
ncbi:hypothetical protein [Actinomycetospora termitidis]|uniref:Uncharacterized protein n=1 Tax=Actinomycetospora termitidis TaxID=3053470 RepID=A0ABT7M5T4_9PSEU|nr:hypothetical protein [Actinomycetospora sp. Odt1-22]MDL5156023.1 hypothetical protein [Actinomycetospora sp. Odt1-22]